MKIAAETTLPTSRQPVAMAKDVMAINNHKTLVGY